MSSPCRILYVDDDKDSCELARILLNYSNTGCTITTSDSAEEALLLIDKSLFDLYIFDYWMPEICGIELCRYVRQSDSDTPILFFSAMARPFDIAEGIKAGANEYLIKPNDLEKLPGTVKRLLAENSTVRSGISLLENRTNSMPEKSSLQTSHAGKSQPSVWKIGFEESTADSLKITPTVMSKVKVWRKETNFNRNSRKAVNVGKARLRTVLTGTAIFAAIVLHFVLQSVFFKNEKTPPLITSNEQRVEPAMQHTGKISDIRIMPDIVQPEAKIEPPPPGKIRPARTAVKKTESRESKAERLRRAEKILTGV